MTRTNRHLTLPQNVKRKDDTSKNAEGLHEKLIMQQEREKKLYPLRIRKDITILVSEEKCNKEYAEWFGCNRLKN